MRIRVASVPGMRMRAGAQLAQAKTTLVLIVRPIVPRVISIGGIGESWRFEFGIPNPAIVHRVPSIPAFRTGLDGTRG